MVDDIIYQFRAGSVAQNSSESVKDSLNEIPFINTIEQSLNLFYAEYANDTSLDSLKKAIEENGGSILKYQMIQYVKGCLE